MAYVFDSIDNQLSGGRQTNVFGGGTNAAAGTTPGTPAGNIRTSTEGDFTPATASSAATPGHVPIESANQNVGAAIAKSNQAAFTGMPAAFRNEANKIDADMQAKANEYVTAGGKRGQEGNVDAATIQNAIKGDADAMGKVAARRDAAAPTIDPYQYDGDQTIDDLNLLNSNSGISGYLSRNANEGYSSGMAGLDAMLLGQNKDFIRERQGLNEKQTDIKKRAADTTPTTEAAQLAATRNFNEGTGFITDYLGNEQKNLSSQQQREMKAHNDRIKAIQRDPYVNSQTAQALANLQKAKGSDAYAPFLSEAVKNLGPDVAGKYYTAPKLAKSANQFFDADEAAKWNNINSLLGTGGQAVVAGDPLSANQGYNLQGYQGEVLREAQRLAHLKQLADDERARNAPAAETSNQPMADDLFPGVIVEDVNGRATFRPNDEEYDTAMRQDEPKPLLGSGRVEDLPEHFSDVARILGQRNLGISKWRL